MYALTQYQEAYGQTINFDKSEMIFSPNISNDAKKEFYDKLPIKINDRIQKYLGLPTQFGRSKEQDFSFIMDRIWKKLKGWKEKSLSFEGRGVLIRAVTQVIPTYYMSCFLLPKGLCEKIERVVCSFWWGSTNTKKKIHWKNKEILFKFKHDGGMVFKSLRDFNIAMLAKQVWRFHTNLNTLIAKCFKSKYYPHTDILEADLGNNPNYAWRSIQNAIWPILKGSCWRVGKGDNIRIWDDNWIPTYHSLRVLNPKRNNPHINKVKDLIRA
ncbi:uncharacterized mitochondrial protein AtMg00310-like [Medicago truncatula]|uniref:uncharacterized mitochondrial protein AtMg00310-like n=1 Tax=Medicago truncatula TaxID=3880 RepID=UPI000D2F42F2|nr:uncharacterized mitochondrial protein AtMg00310-like [Medicago truncatula]